VSERSEGAPTLNVHKRRTAEDVVNQAWLEDVVRDMLADSGPHTVPPPPAIQCDTDDLDEDRPSRRQRRAQHLNRGTNSARDGYGRPIRPAAKLIKDPASVTRIFKPQGCGAST